MKEMQEKIQKFTDLIVWQEAHKLVIMTYRISSAFPKDELFGLTNQIRRAAVSITSNIAEGFGRKTMKDRLHFYTISHGSLNEVLNQFIVAKDIKYLGEKDWNEVEEQTIIVSKLLNGLIKKSNSFILTLSS